MTDDAKASGAKAPGILYVAATPLGNLQDISHRLEATLRDAALVLAEDTRRSGIVLVHLGIKKPLRSLHSHNELTRTSGVLEALGRGEAVVLVSDAGTPAVSDPGAHLVTAVHAAGFAVCPIPGPSALTASLSAAGFTPGEAGALFMGFLPRSGAARSQALMQICSHKGVVVVFEAPDRLGKTLAQLSDSTPERQVCLCRELTKMHEEVCVAPLAQMAERYASKPPRGEITFVLAPLPPPDVDVAEPSELHLPTSLQAAVRDVMAAGVSAKDTAAALAIALGVPRREVYACAIAQSRDSDAS